MKLNHKFGTHEEQLLNALAMMASALEALDQLGGFNDVGAHLDLAICRLSSALEIPWPVNASDLPSSLSN